MKTRLLAGCISAVIAAGCLTYAAPNESAIPVQNAFAASVNDLTFSLIRDYAIVERCSKRASGVLEIPAEYSGMPVKVISCNAFSECYDLTKIILPDTVNAIKSDDSDDNDYNPFYHAEQLKEINIPVYVADIPAYCFNGCQSLTTVKIAEGVLHIEKYAFKGCTSLTNIDLPMSITRIGEMAFDNCSLDNITIKNKDTIIKELGAKSIKQITGYPGSTAELYAKEHQIDFVDIDIKTGSVTSGTTTAQAATAKENITTTRTTTTATWATTTTVTTTTTRETITTATTATAKATTTSFTGEMPPKNMLKYDVNGDYTIDIADAVLLVRYITEDDSVKIPENGNPDINADGVLTIEDVMEVFKSLTPFSVKIGKTTAKPGETVKVPVQVYGDKGTAGGQVYISYDSRLTPVSITAGDAYSMNFQSENGSYPLYFAWTSQNGLDQTAKDGSVIAYLEFEADPNIQKTEYLEISIVNQAGWNDTRFSDSTGYLYSVSYGSGYITVIP